MSRMSQEQLETRRASMAEIVKQRHEISWELVREVVPRKEAESTPKYNVAKEAVALYRSEQAQRKDGDPFLSSHSDKFINVETLLSYWPSIRQIAAGDGFYLTWSPGKGVYATTSKSVIARSFEMEQAQLENHVERINTRADKVNKRRKLQIPSLRLQLALPPPVGE